MIVPLLLKRQDAADYLGVSVETLTRLVNDHRIARVPIGGDWMYPREELEEFCRREKRRGRKLPCHGNEPEALTGSATSTSTASDAAMSSPIRQVSADGKPRPWRDKSTRRKSGTGQNQSAPVVPLRGVVSLGDGGSNTDSI